MEEEKYDRKRNTHERQVHDAALDSRGTLDSLEPDGKIEDEKHESCTKSESVPCSRPDRSFFDNSWWNSCLILLPNLNTDKGSNENGEENE